MISEVFQAVRRCLIKFLPKIDTSSGSIPINDKQVMQTSFRLSNRSNIDIILQHSRYEEASRVNIAINGIDRNWWVQFNYDLEGIGKVIENEDVQSEQEIILRNNLIETIIAFFETNERLKLKQERRNQVFDFLNNKLESNIIEDSDKLYMEIVPEPLCIQFIFGNDLVTIKFLSDAISPFMGMYSWENEIIGGLENMCLDLGLVK